MKTKKYKKNPKRKTLRKHFTGGFNKAKSMLNKHSLERELLNSL
jgi:hypothetical protein